jgi:hypothetical protein
MCRLSFGLILLGIVEMAYAAQTENIVFFHNLDLLTVQTVQFDLGVPASVSHYRFTASIALTPTADTAPYGFWFSRTSRLTSAVELQKEIIWATNSNWMRFFDSDRKTLAPLLRFESNGQQIEIRPRSHSLWLQWRKTFP